MSVQTSGLSSSQFRILAVDDEPYIREIVSRWLAAEGYDCATAANADEALDMLEHDQFSLLMSDIMMPGRSGIELLALVKERFPEVAVIMATAVDDRKTAIRTLELGAYGYVVKPLDHNEVLINVANALERRRLFLMSRDYERQLEEEVRSRTADIRLAGPMHDVGKIGVSDNILRKPGKLTPEEFETMKTHTVIGAKMLAGSNIPLLQMSKDIALSHHEKWSGAGYPNGLVAEAIPESARLVAIADVYDALVHKRVYKPAFPEPEAIEIMTKDKGKHFDPKAFDCFLSLLPEFHRIREEFKDE